MCSCMANGKAIEVQCNLILPVFLFYHSVFQSFIICLIQIVGFSDRLILNIIDSIRHHRQYGRCHLFSIFLHFPKYIFHFNLILKCFFLSIFSILNKHLKTLNQSHLLNTIEIIAFRNFRLDKKQRTKKKKTKVKKSKFFKGKED